MPADDLIDQFAEHLRRAGRSAEYTVRDWRATLTRADRQLPAGLDRASDREIAEWLDGRAWAPATRYAYWSCLRSFYRWAVAEQLLALDPTEFLARPRRPRGVPRPCTDAELAQILTRAREPVRTWAVLAAYGALRCLEISRLDREHVTADGIRLHGKGDKWRVVPAHPLVLDAVAGLPPGPVAASTVTGRRLSGRSVSARAVTHFHGDLAMPGMSLHRLRHWCLTNIQAAFGDLRVTQEIAGHASPQTTAVYTLVTDERRRAAIATLPLLTPAASAASAASAATAHP